MIELKAVQLRKQYTHRRLFSELSFEHRSGVLGIAGANGSGKSTLLRCIAFLQGIDAGEIHWNQEGNTSSAKILGRLLDLLLQISSFTMN